MKYSREYKLHLTLKIDEAERNFYKSCGSHQTLCDLLDNFTFGSPEYTLVDIKRMVEMKKADYYYDLIRKYQEELELCNKYLKDNNL